MESGPSESQPAAEMQERKEENMIDPKSEMNSRIKVADAFKKEKSLRDIPIYAKVDIPAVRHPNDTSELKNWENHHGVFRLTPKPPVDDKMSQEVLDILSSRAKQLENLTTWQKFRRSLNPAAFDSELMIQRVRAAGIGHVQTTSGATATERKSAPQPSAAPEANRVTTTPKTRSLFSPLNP